MSALPVSVIAPGVSPLAPRAPLHDAGLSEHVCAIRRTSLGPVRPLDDVQGMALDTQLHNSRPATRTTATVTTTRRIKGALGGATTRADHHAYADVASYGPEYTPVRGRRRRRFREEMGAPTPASRRHAAALAMPRDERGRYIGAAAICASLQRFREQERLAGSVAHATIRDWYKQPVKAGVTEEEEASTSGSRGARAAAALHGNGKFHACDACYRVGGDLQLRRAVKTAPGHVLNDAVARLGPGAVTWDDGRFGERGDASVTQCRITYTLSALV